MIAALITLYNPENNVIDHVKTISAQVDKVFLCDNSSSDNKEKYMNIVNVVYIYHNKNLALSSAFNNVLKNPNIGWNDDDIIIFFDQDSFIDEGHIKGLLNEYYHLCTIGYNVGCIGPVYYNLNTNHIAIPRIKKKITKDSYIVSSIITSSLLCKYGDLRAVNFWNEEIFLDLADWDLSWRLIRNGQVCIKTKVVVLKHALGLGEKKVGFIKLGKASPVREYYQTRNYLYLLHAASDSPYERLCPRMRWAANRQARCCDPKRSRRSLDRFFMFTGWKRTADWEMHSMKD